MKFLSRWLSNFSLSAMAGSATLPPPRPGPAGSAPTTAPHRRSQEAGRRLRRPPVRPLPSSRPASAASTPRRAAPSCPEPRHHSSSGEDDRGAGGGGNGGGMCCRLRGGGSLDLRARLCGHAHHRQPATPIGRPGSGALGQSKGAMEKRGRKRKRKGEGRVWDRKEPGRRGRGRGGASRGGRSRRKPERGGAGRGRGRQGRTVPFVEVRWSGWPWMLGFWTPFFFSSGVT